MGGSQAGMDEVDRERIVIFQCGARVRMPVTMDRPRKGEAPPAIATVGMVYRGG